MEKTDNNLNEKDSFLKLDLPDPELEKEKTCECFGKDTTLTRTQLVTLTLITIYFFLAALYYSLFAPFLPGNALSKGVTQTEIGLIFCTYQLAILIFSPIFGKNLEKIGVRVLFVYGLLITAIGQISFGIIDYFENKWVYLSIALVTRAVAGMGVSMAASYGIASVYFPKQVSRVIAMLELANGLGLTLGPPLGGFMYEFGGFQFPFWFVGGFVFFLFVIAFFTFPQPVKQEVKKKESLPMLPLFKIPKYVLIVMILTAVSLSMGFLGPSIQIYLKPLGLSPIQLGFLLFIAPFLYALTSPIIGVISDKKPNSREIILAISGLICAISTSFLGPIPFYHLPLNIWIVISAFVGFGIALGGAMIPVFAELSSLAIKNGYKDDVALQGLISGTFNTFFALGSLIGPILGGFVVDQIGFPYSSLVIVSMFGISSTLYLIAQLVCKSKSKQIDSQ